MNESEAAPLPEGQPDPASEPNGLENEAGANPEQPESASSGDDPNKGKTAKGVQKRLDELTRRANDAERREERLLALLEKGGMSATKAESVVAENAEPVRANFATPEEYLEARTDYQVGKKLEELEARRAETERRTKAEQAAHAVETTWSEAVGKAKAKYDDFEDVAYTDPKDGGPFVTHHMADAIKTSEIGPEIAYWLGKNVAESKRIAALSPAAQAREIGKLEAQVASPTKTVKTSKAPDPIEPVTGKTTVRTDLRGDESMDEIYRSMFPGKGRRSSF